MMTNTLLFPILILIFGVMILWILIGCKGWWTAKFWIINIACILFFVFWTTLISYMGWGVPQPLPDRFRLVGYSSDEPVSLFVLTELEKKNEFNIKNIFDYKSEDSIRLYKIPYKKQLHQQLESAMEKVMRGALVYGSKTRILEAEEVNGMSSLDGDSQGGLNGNDHSFYVLPPSKMFQKPKD
jgi:hypothetical protein